MRDYELVHPGAAKWIFDQAEQNAAHVRAMEKSGLRLRWWDAMLHRLLPFAVVVIFLGGFFFVAIYRSALIGGIGMGGTLAAVLGAYLTGRMPKSNGAAPGSG